MALSVLIVAPILQTGFDTCVASALLMELCEILMIDEQISGSGYV